MSNGFNITIITAHKLTRVGAASCTSGYIIIFNKFKLKNGQNQKLFRDVQETDILFYAKLKLY